MRSQAVWRAPLRRARRAIDSAIGRIETSGRVIEATLRFAASRPIERARQLGRLSQWVDEAGRQLQRALRRVDESVRQIKLAPERADGSPLLLIDTTWRWVETAVRLDQLSHRLVAASEQIVEETRNWAASSQARAATAAPAQPARAASLRHPRFVLVLVIRHAPAAFATAADAVRKICRGRAPPLFQPARSHHRG